MAVHLFAEPGLDGLEQVPIHNGRLFASQDLTLEGHFSNIEAIAKQMCEWPAREWNAADSPSGFQGADLGDNAPLAQVGHKPVEAAKPEIAAEDGPDPLSLGFVDGDPAILGVVAKRGH